MCIICIGGDLKGIKDLDCSICSVLTKIQNIKGLKSLFCYECSELTRIPNIQELEFLDCSECPQLTKIPNIKGLKRLHCSECPQLTKISNIKTLQALHCRGCPLLYIPREDEIRLNRKGTLFYFKLKRRMHNTRKIIKNKNVFRNILLPKDILLYVIFKY